MSMGLKGVSGEMTAQQRRNLERIDSNSHHLLSIINDVSERMNPLKLYVYYSLGVPIVTTRVANIEEVGPFATVADTQEDFVAALDRLVARGSGQHTRPAPSALKDISWPDRIEQVIGLIDAAIG